MRLFRYCSFLAVCLLAPLFCLAQNNSYGLDDSCYPLFREADSILGTQEAPAVIDALQETAQKVSDTKSLTLVEILRLRQAIREKDEEAILSHHAKAKECALGYGFLQYYFYADHLISTYYYNAGQKLKALEYATSMHEEAVNMGNDYGQWYSAKYLADIYLADYKRSFAVEALKEAVRTYENTDDQTIRKQSMTKTYTMLAMLSGYGSPQYPEYVDKALETSKIAIDTTLVNYCLACDAAVTGKKEVYLHYRDLCLSDRQLSRAHSSAHVILGITDRVMAGQAVSSKDGLADIPRLEDLTYVADLGAAYGQLWLVRDCYDMIASRLANTYESQLDQALTETAVMMENRALNEKVMEQKTRANNLLLFLVIFIISAVVLLGILSALYIKKLQKTKAEADRASRMKTHFVQNMSHEIRTPLNAVVGFSQLLALDEGDLGEEEKSEYIDYITNNSSLLMMLIDDILDMSDIDSGNYRMLIRECNCNEICRMALKTVDCRIPYGVTTSFVSDVPEDMTIRSDDRRVQQIIINFLTNSCKHTAQGVIELRCSTDVKPGYVSFAVRDTGSGIPADQADNIFNRFLKLDSFKQGSGLGLNICQGLAEKLGGIVELDRTYGRTAGEDGVGARFYLHLSI